MFFLRRFTFPARANVAQLFACSSHSFLPTPVLNSVYISPSKNFIGANLISQPKVFLPLARSLSTKSEPNKTEENEEAESAEKSKITFPNIQVKLKQSDFWKKFPPPRRGKDWVAQIAVRSFDSQKLDYACNYVRHLAVLTGVRVGNVIGLPTRTELTTVIRSPHVHKTSREQFCIQTFKRLICVYDSSPEALAHFFHELDQRPPQAVGIFVKEQRRVPLPKPRNPSSFPRREYSVALNDDFSPQGLGWSSEIFRAGNVGIEENDFEDPDREAVDAGCVLWTDDSQTRWCKDVDGAFGAGPGALSRLMGDVWHIVVEHQDDGCLYWTDAQGSRWCRDVQGVWGPAGGQYCSVDGGVTWYGDGEGWLTLSDEACDLFARAALTRRRRRELIGRSRAGAAKLAPRNAALPKQDSLASTTVTPLQEGDWQNPLERLRLSSNADGGTFDAAVVTAQLTPLDSASGASWTSVARAELYGASVHVVVAREAAADAAFDLACREAAAACGGRAPPLWPELPLRL